MLKKRYVVTTFIVCAACLIKLDFGSKTNVFANASAENNIKYSEERKYLQDLESLNTTDIENELRQAEKSEQEKDYLDENGNIDFKKYYKETIFMGDSITEYISAANILPESNVYAKKGKTILGVEEYVQKLQYSKSDRVILLFGMNDVSSFSSVDDFKNKYIKLVNDIKEITPDTKIYLQSPTPIQAKAENTEQGLNNENLDKFRQAVKETAEQTGVTYVDITVLISSDEYYEPDGMHFNYKFYNVLFNYLKDTIEENEKE